MGDRRRGAKTEEGDLLRLGKQVHRPVNRGNIQTGFHMLQTGHRRFKNFAGIGVNTIIFFDVAIHIRCAIRQTLRQMQFKIRKAFGFKTAAKRLTVGSLTTAILARVAILEWIAVCGALRITSATFLSDLLRISRRL